MLQCLLQSKLKLKNVMADKMLLELIAGDFEDNSDTKSECSHGFMSMHVHISHAKQHKEGEEDKQMSVKTLWTMKWILLNLTFENLECSREDTSRWKNLLSNVLLFGLDELQILVAEALHNPLCIEAMSGSFLMLTHPFNLLQALQYVVIVLASHFTGLCPGSIFTTRHTKTFLKLKVHAFHAGIPGIDGCLGHQTGQVNDRLQNLFAYLGGYVLALGIIRKELVGFETAQEVFESDGRELNWVNPKLSAFRTQLS
ncbi:hypothetical protein B0H16DRAFT_1486052 [Mycena metata]|uniref:Uncharacterized protein n=1 Tax=Mycena metata TaxID=1033252 RepID=A0AAD7DL94_9AGAR|nr:hypothetical protein B0H16DRAFT_1486052 [Mycena metata]